MKAISTKYLSATLTKPSRIKASAEGVPAKLYTVESLSVSGWLADLHKAAARQFAGDRGWSGKLASGGTENPDVWVHCFADSFVNDFKRINDIVFAEGAPLGSGNYFEIRGIVSKYL